MDRVISDKTRAPILILGNLAPALWNGSKVLCSPTDRINRTIIQCFTGRWHHCVCNSSDILWHQQCFSCQFIWSYVWKLLTPGWLPWDTKLILSLCCNHSTLLQWNTEFQRIPTPPPYPSCHYSSKDGDLQSLPMPQSLPIQVAINNSNKS